MPYKNDYDNMSDIGGKASAIIEKTQVVYKQPKYTNTIQAVPINKVISPDDQYRYRVKNQAESPRFETMDAYLQSPMVVERSNKSNLQ